MTTFFDTFLAVIRAPETVFFIEIAIIIVLIYILGVIGSIFNRVTSILVEADAVYKAIFGEEGIAELQDAQQTLQRIGGVLRSIQETQRKVKEHAAEATK